MKALTRARANILDQIRLLDAKVRSIARQNAVVRRLMSVPGVGDLAELAALCFRTYKWDSLWRRFGWQGQGGRL